jgi:hypothetical protein
MYTGYHISVLSFSILSILCKCSFRVFKRIFSVSPKKKEKKKREYFQVNYLWKKSK